MVYDLDMLKAFYASFEKKIGRVRAVLQRPLTLAEKILYTHLYDCLLYTSAIYNFIGILHQSFYNTKLFFNARIAD